MMDSNIDLLQWFINFLTKNPLHLHGQRPYGRSYATRDKSASGSAVKK